MRTLLGICLAAALLVDGTAGAAQANIVCRDGYQLSGGREISTPYCNDALIAEVARAHGQRVTAAEVRNNPSRKHELCRWVGSDVRIQQYCPDESSDRAR